MIDYGHKETDELIKQMNGKVAKIYKQASEDTQKKLVDYLKAFKRKDAEKRKLLDAGAITQEEYTKWRTGQIMIGKRWKEMRDTLAEDYHNANAIARSTVQEYMPEVYALNHNYGTFQVEKASGVDTSYTLYDRQTVERLMREEPELLPAPGEHMQDTFQRFDDYKSGKPVELTKKEKRAFDKLIADNKDIRWQKGQIQSVMTQAILQGESVPHMAQRVARTMGEINRKATTRYVRTAATGAQNAGRVDSYKRAESMGIELEQEWLATLDDRTRDEHRELDGQHVPVGQPFKVGGKEIRFPGDPAASGHLIWNCRCTLVPWLKNVDQSNAPRYSDIDDMSYEKWKHEHEDKEEDITYSIDREQVKQFISDKFADAPESYRQALLDSVDNMSNEMIDIVKRTSNAAEIYYYDESGTCLKVRSSDTIYMYKGDKDEQDFVGTFWHEYGHLTDKSPNGGYSKDVIYTNSRGREHSFTVTGIAGIAEEDSKYAQAVADDINAFLKRYGLDDKYESGVGEFGRRYFKVIDGDYIDPINMPYEQSKELSDAMSSWVKDISGHRKAWDYLYDNGYPRTPEWNQYYETYTTPKRQIVRTRERYKGAADDWHKAMRAASDAQDEFVATHDMDALFAEQKRLEAIANERASKLGYAADTFDEGAFGSFHSIVSAGGHSAEYYMQGGHDEYVANVFSALATEDPVVIEGMQDLCPNVYNLVRGIILG